MNTFKRIILVTGTPGVGKTSVSNLMASRLKANHIDLGELVRREQLISEVDKSRGTLIADTSKLSKRLKNMMEANQMFIIDGHYAVDVVSVEEVELVFVLRRDPDELKHLMKRKGFTERKIWENLAAEILDVCLLDAIEFCKDKVCEIDTSGKEIREVVEDVISVIKGGKKRQVGIVDWLGKLNEEERLHEFFQSL